MGSFLLRMTLAACGGSEDHAASPAASTGSEIESAPTPAVEPSPPRAAFIHCNDAAMARCDEYIAGHELVDEGTVQEMCAGSGGLFGAGACPTQGQIGYCATEAGRVYAYRPMNIALAETLLCAGADWTVVAPMGLP